MESHVHNLVAFFGSVAQNAALANLPPAYDPLVTVTPNSRVIFPEDYWIGAAHVQVVDGTRARINSPSFRTIALPELYPIDITAAIGTNPPMIGPMWDQLRVPRNDEFGIDVSRAGAGAGNCFGAIWVAPRFTPAPSGPVYSMRATAAITLTVGTWVAGSLTFDQVLPSGRYAVVGMDCVCNDGMYARLTFPGGTQYRPGVPCVEAVGDYVNPQIFRSGRFGLFGTFESTAQPGIEIMGDTAGAETPTIILDLIKVA
jgi:hypothetical protein